MINFGIVGTGWRSEFYLRIAAACPDRFRVVGLVTRDVARASEGYAHWGAPLFPSIDAMMAESSPLFVVVSVPWDANPTVLKVLATAGVPSLSETPPATTVAEMEELYTLVEQGAKIQVVEQFWAQPHHAARLAFAASGKLGRVSQAQVSVCHGYHGISLMRRFLGVGFENVVVTGQSFTSPIIKGQGRDGFPEQEEIVDSGQAIAQFDFGDRLGVVDFTGEQYFSFVRAQRLLVRGERGEIIDERATYLPDQYSPIAVNFERVATGVNGNLEGNYLKGIRAGESWLYHNPLAPAALPDEEIAIATCMLRMAEYAEGGPDFYSLAEACQDRYLGIIMEQAIEGAQPISSKTQSWA